MAELQLDGLRLRSATCRSQHSLISIESRHPSSMARERRRQCAVATAEVEHVQTVDGGQQMENETFLHRVGDLTQAAAPPMAVRLGKPRDWTFIRRCAVEQIGPVSHER